MSSSLVRYLKIALLLFLVLPNTESIGLRKNQSRSNKLPFQSFIEENFKQGGCAQDLPGAAKDVGIGADGTMWIIGSGTEGGGYGIYRWNKGTLNWDKMPGGAVRISVGPDGMAWLVNNAGNVFRYTGSSWQMLSATALDIAVGADNSVYITGTDQRIYKLKADRLTWEATTGTGSYRVAVDPKGNPWNLDINGKISKWNGVSWEAVPSEIAYDLSIAPNGDVYYVASYGQVLKLNALTKTWVAVPGASNGYDVAVGPNGDVLMRDYYDKLHLFGNTACYIRRCNQDLPGAAKDVGYGADDTMWIIGSGAEVGGYGIYRWNKVNFAWDKMPGGAVRISVGPDGMAWVVNNDGTVFKYTGSTWQALSGKAKDIAVGADNTVYIVGTDTALYKLKADRITWEVMAGTSAVRVAVDAQGNPWHLNSSGYIFKWTGSGWDWLPGAAKDVSIGPNGDVYAVSTSNQLLRWDGVARNWSVVAGALTASDVAVGPNGNVLYRDDTNKIRVFGLGACYLKRCTQDLPGAAKEIGYGAEGTMWVLGNAQENYGNSIYKWNKAINDWENKPLRAVKLSVAPDGNAWVVTNVGSIYKFIDGSWEMVPGKAKDVAVGAGLVVYSIGTDNSIYKYNQDTATWQVMAGTSAARIAVDPQGNPWHLNSSGYIFKWTGSGWDWLPGAAKDISIGLNGDVYAIGTANQLLKWDGTARLWNTVPGAPAGSKLSVGPNGNILIRDDTDRIRRFGPAACPV